MKPLRRRKVRAGHALWTLVALWAMGGTGIAGAAVYNLYFNNVEQGDNGTATPTLSLQSKDEGAKLLPSASPAPQNFVLAPSPEPSPSPTPVPEASPTPVAASTTETVKASESRHRLFRFGLSTAAVGSISGGYYVGQSYLANFSFFPTRYLGLNAYGGGVRYSNYGDYVEPHFGLDLQVIPFQIGLFGHQDAMEIGFLGGMTNLAAVSENWVSLYVGALAEFNIGDRVSLTASYRMNRAFMMADFGVGFRF